MKLLIAEDDALIRMGLRDILDAEGYECHLAENGTQALELYHSVQPQLVLLDIMMPDKDGYAVCREIRAHDSSTAIIFISAKSEEIDQVLGLELGADDYIMKPFGKHEVVARIRAVTRRSLVSSSQSSASDKKEKLPLEFSIGDLIVRPSELRAFRDDVSIELSLRDCQILQLLADNPNEIITRDLLFNRCWGTNYLPNSRTLDQQISQLRKRIELDPKSPQIIRTVHGVGYRYQVNR